VCSTVNHALERHAAVSIAGHVICRYAHNTNVHSHALTRECMRAYTRACTHIQGCRKQTLRLGTDELTLGTKVVGDEVVIPDFCAATLAVPPEPGSVAARSCLLPKCEFIGDTIGNPPTSS
jgi:hypothetical protein